MLRNLRFEKFDNVVCGEIGTIRTIPENYYVASVYLDGTIIFEGVEACTKNIDKDAVLWWANMDAKINQNRAA